MANRFWVGQTGNWSDNANHWSATDGGAPNASKPTSADNVYFTANSFNGGGQSVTLDEIANCLDMDWTGATNTPAFAISNVLNVYGSLLFIAAMTQTGTSDLTLKATSSGKTIATNGLSLVCTFVIDGSGGVWTLQDDLISTSHLYFKVGTLVTNNKVVTILYFFLVGAGAKALTLGSSVFTCSRWQGSGASNFTIDAGASTIKVLAVGQFDGLGLTYNNVELNGTAHTISGDGSKFKAIKVGRAAPVTITGTAGETYTVESFFATDNANLLTIDSTGAAWTITGNSGYCELDYTDITNVIAGYKYIYYAGDHSTDGTGNTNWIFTRKVRQQMFPRR